MVSWKLFIFFKGISLFHIFHNLSKKYNNIYHYITDYYYGYNNIWVFISDNRIPIPLNNVRNTFGTCWLFDNYENKLIYSNETNKCKLSWLSAKVQTESKEYEMDSFIENFYIYTTEDNPPTLDLIFMCWCIYTKQWFQSDITICIFDDTGNENMIHLNDTLIIKNNKIYKN